MPKTLVIAEKPSVGRDLVRVLPGAFNKQGGKGEEFLEGPDHVVTWAVGHLVQLADPDEYDDKYKKWRMADLPIVPERFKLVVRDERSKKQMNVVKRLLGRDDVDQVVNACDAGREGELIFAYLYEKAGSRKPVRRLWLNSMTKSAIEAAFAELRPGDEYASLEAAARSRSEADWIVGMNSTRAATIRLRSSFDGAVSLGRVQTPTLAILARREEEIRAFVPEPYWVVDAAFRAVAEPAGRVYEGRYHAAPGGETGARGPRLKSAEEARAIVRPAATRWARSPSSRSPSAGSAPRCSMTSPRFSATPTAASASPPAAPWPPPSACMRSTRRSPTRARTPATSPATWSAEIKPIAKLVGGKPEYAAAAQYVLGLDVLPLGRVVNDAKVTDHHAIIPTNAERHPIDKMNEDDLRVYDLVVRRFLAVFHPEAVSENTRVETTVATHVFRTRGKLLLVPGWRGVYGETAELDDAPADDEDEGREQRLPRLNKGEDATVTKVADEAKETKPPRRYTERSLLDMMETAGKLVEEEELREAMKESGIGTPATRAAIIERLLQVGYIERDGRALVVTEKGLNVIRLLGEHPLTAPGSPATGSTAWPRSRPAAIRARSSWATSSSSPSRRSASWTPSSRTCASRAPISVPARCAAATSTRTARATRAGAARTRAAAS